MALISASDLGKAYGPEDIFSGLSFSIPHRSRIGLVGSNGVGKTTLLRILIGTEEPSSGKIQRSRDLKIGYLPQQAVFTSEQSLWNESLTAFQDLLDIQKQLTSLESLMEFPDQADQALEDYGKLQTIFDQRGGYTYESRIRQTLFGLGFLQDDFQRPMNQLSGGQRTRALLAQLLLSDPDLLLLDEPTNHLDIASIEWLESYLKDYSGAVLIVSHDRYFLDQVVNVVWEMTPNLEVFHGNYSAYLDQRTERYERRLAEYQSQQAFIQKEEDYIRRNIAGQNTRQAQGRRKRLERMIEESRLTPPAGTRRLSLRLKPVGRSGDLVLRTQSLSIGYEDEGRPLFSVPDLVLGRGELAAILGPNGAGKTTFLKTLLGIIPPFAGSVSLGANLQIGYFAQAHEDLHLDWTLMQEIEAASSGMLPADIRNYLARFLFTGDDVFKLVNTLSGGERGRLALACLALQGANLLLLDEPTNHLDLPSQEVLQSMLADYQGTILLVSHDRYLIDALATQIWDVIPEQKLLRVYEGSYSQYRTALQKESSSPSDEEQDQQNKKQEKNSSRPKGYSKNKVREQVSRLHALEDEIAEMEKKLAVITRQFESGNLTALQAQDLSVDYQDLQKAMDKKLNEWTEFLELNPDMEEYLSEEKG